MNGLPPELVATLVGALSVALTRLIAKYLPDSGDKKDEPPRP
jgi:hypothetical protein